MVLRKGEFFFFLALAAQLVFCWNVVGRKVKNSRSRAFRKQRGNISALSRKNHTDATESRQKLENYGRLVQSDCSKIKSKPLADIQ